MSDAPENPKEKEYYGLPEWVRLAGFGFMLALVVAEFFVSHHAYFDAFDFAGAYGLIGLLGGLLLVILAKVFDVFVRRDEGYYRDQ